MRKRLILLAIALLILLNLPTIIVWQVQRQERKRNYENGNDIPTDTNDLFIIYLYEPKEHLKQECWVRALTKLAQIYEDPNITRARMTAGWLESGGCKGGHAWIEYTTRDSNDVIRYDPSCGAYLEPLPEDANLLTPIIPKEPREALEIMEAKDGN